VNLNAYGIDDAARNILGTDCRSWFGDYHSCTNLCVHCPEIYGSGHEYGSNKIMY